MLFEVNKEQMAKRLKDICKKLKKSPEELAERLKVKPVTLNKWLRGEGIPSKVNLQKIQNMSNTPVNKILYGSMDELISYNIENFRVYFDVDFKEEQLKQEIVANSITIYKLDELEELLKEIGFYSSVHTDARQEVFELVSAMHTPIVATNIDLMGLLTVEDQIKVGNILIDMLKAYELNEEEQDMVEFVEDIYKNKQSFLINKYK